MLTALVHQKLPELRFVEWFRDPDGPGSCYPKGPVAVMTRSQFESIGLDFVRLHFDSFERQRLHSKDSSRLVESAEEKKLLKKHVPVGIYRHHETGDLLLIPCRFRQYNMGGWVWLDKDLFKHGSLSFDCSSEEFIRTFDAVAAEAG
jgi:hypothetical protein